MNCKLLQSCIVGTYFTKVRTHIYKNKVNARKRRWMYNASFYENEESHERIFKLLTSDKPVMIARYGFTEINIRGCYLTGGGTAAGETICMTQPAFSPKVLSEQMLI